VRGVFEGKGPLAESRNVFQGEKRKDLRRQVEGMSKKKSQDRLERRHHNDRVSEMFKERLPNISFHKEEQRVFHFQGQERQVQQWSVSVRDRRAGVVLGVPDSDA